MTQMPDLERKFEYTNKDREPAEHKVPFGDKTLCVLLMDGFTLVKGTIKNPTAYSESKNAKQSDYELILKEQKQEAEQAVIDYFDNRLTSNRPAFELITKNIQFWT